MNPWAWERRMAREDGKRAIRYILDGDAGLAAWFASKAAHHARNSTGRA